MQVLEIDSSKVIQLGSSRDGIQPRGDIVLKPFLLPINPHDSHNERANAMTWSVALSAMVLDHDSFFMAGLYFQ